MKQRPILVAVIGYIIGILWGLYLQFSIVPFYILTYATYIIIKKIKITNNKKIESKTFKLKENQTTLKQKNKHQKTANQKTKKEKQKIKTTRNQKETKKTKIKLISLKRYMRYAKLYINKKVIIIIITTSIISGTITTIQNKQYKEQYKEEQNIKITGIIISQKTEKDYYNMYKIKILPKGQYNMYIQTKKNEKELEYGDKIEIEGEYSKPEEQRNYKGYDESQYFKTQKILGRIKVNKIKVIAKKQINPILQQANQIKLKIKNIINKAFTQDKAAVLNGLILGEKEDLEEQIKENYQTLSISHILAISGMHIQYIIIGMQILLKKVIGKRETKIVIIVMLIIYVFITGYSPSIFRATMMGILTVSQTLFYRKNDIWNSISISLLGILIYNPFSILDLGLQLSYLGTIGIILFYSTISQILDNITRTSRK